MFRSLNLGKFFGIDLYVHPTFWLLPLLVFASGSLAGDVSGAAFQVGVLLAVFGCVALHEVGHALAGRYYDIGTRDITLYPIGGVARLERMPEKPLQEIVIALAGPAVNVAILVGILAGVAGREFVLPGAGASAAGDPAEVFLQQVAAANLMLVLFNLLPAFPMDGGRVLRAVLALGLPRVEATRVAVWVGAAVAVGFVLVGLYGLPFLGIPAGNFGLILVAGVVYLLGQAELAAVKAQAARRAARRWAEPVSGPAEPADRFTGWRWDPRRGVWGLYHDGELVREVYPG